MLLTIFGAGGSALQRFSFLLLELGGVRLPNPPADFGAAAGIVGGGLNRGLVRPGFFRAAAGICQGGLSKELQPPPPFRAGMRAPVVRSDRGWVVGGGGGHPLQT